MPDKPYPVGQEKGEELEPKQEPKTGYDHEGKPTDMGAPLDAKEMAEGLSKMLGGLPIEIVDKREERKLAEDYVEERVRAREEATGESRDDTKLTKNFSADEFRCRCGKCGLDGQSMPFWFIQDLQALRDEANIPLRITSGIRCEAYNRSPKVRGKPNSAHLRGMAADIEVLTSMRRFWIIKKALALGFTRIGIGREFLHVDKDAGLPQNVMWVYGTKNPTTL